MAADVTGADEFGSYFRPTHYIGWANDLGSSDFTFTMSLVITGLEDSGAYFTFNTRDSYFGFSSDGDVVYRSGPFCKAYCLPDMMLLVYDASAAKFKVSLCLSQYLQPSLVHDQLMEMMKAKSNLAIKKTTW